MREHRVSSYSLLLFIFAYMVSLTLYNLAWTNESSRQQTPQQLGGSLRQPKRTISQQEPSVNVAHYGSVEEKENQWENDRYLIKAILEAQGIEESNDQEEQSVWNPKDLLDFAVVDLDETVADIVTAWLTEHPRIQMLASQEDHSNIAGDPFALLNEIHQNTVVEENDKKVIRGYRVDLDHDAEFDALRSFWPKTKLIVVLRHPVRWFEDFYNRYIETSSTPLMLHPNRLIGSCQRPGQTVCTDKADVAFPLLKLGKTMKHPTPRTREILNKNRLRQNLSGLETTVHPNPVFLVTWEQLMDTNVDRQRKLIDDLEYFLGVRSDLPFLRLPLDGRLFENFVHKDAHTRSIDICESNFRPLRKALMDIGRRSSQWIQDDFLPTTTVTCSQVDLFTENLKTWIIDPCEVVETM